MKAAKTVQHAKYTGSLNSNGYRQPPGFQDEVTRKVFGWQHVSTQIVDGPNTQLRTVVRDLVLVPDVSEFSIGDKVTFESVTRLVVDIDDTSKGPYGDSRPAGGGGTVTVEHVRG